MRIYGDILVDVDYRIFFFFFAVSFSCTSFWTLYILFAFKHMPKHLPGCQSEFKPICSSTYACFFFFFFVRLQRQKECHPLSVIFFFYQDADPTKLERREITTYASLAGVPKPTKNCRLLRKSNVVKSRRFIFFSKIFFFLTRPFELAEGINIII